MAEPKEPEKPVSFDHELTVQQVHVPNCNGTGGYAFTCRCS